MSLHPWFKRLWLALLVVAGCKHAPIGPGPIPENKDGSLQVIVDEGDSSQAVYNTKGDKLLFVSKKRPAHEHDQVYEKDLTTGIERRITFQNGSTFEPHYQPKDLWIVYSSSTDELKENPPLLNPNAATSKMPYPYQEPMEVYAHSLHGFEILRLTEHPGFDGEAQFSNDGSSVIFTRVNGPKTEIISFNRSNHVAHAIKNLGTNPTQYITSPDGKAHAWIEWDDSFGVAKLRLQKGKDEAVEIGADQIVTKTDLSFTGDSNWLLWAQKESESAVYDLWAADLKTLCPHRLTTSSEGERRYPVLSPDMKSLTFTLVSKNRSRIARIGFAPPTGPCPTPL